MRGLFRHGLVLTLAIALMVAGLPLAHAQNCVTLHPAVQDIDHDLHHERHDDLAMADHAQMHAPIQQQGGDAVPAPCKCLNCSSLCAAFVVPLPQMLTLQRRVGVIVYAMQATAQSNSAVFIDPGIPIAA